uniref:Uncharacterized protein n=1 Tax=Oryzias latipes TaxID=8090 RepID=A0A3P9KT37_ORYLA
MQFEAAPLQLLLIFMLYLTLIVNSFTLLCMFCTKDSLPVVQITLNVKFLIHFKEARRCFNLAQQTVQIPLNNRTNAFTVNLSSCLSQISSSIMEVDKAKLQEAAIVGLNVLKAVASAASVFFPPIGIAGSLIGVVLKFVDKNDSIDNLKKEFQLIHQGLDELSKQNQQTMKTIIKETADQQFSRVERSLKWQYEKYMKMISAPPEHVQRRSEEFVEAYDDELGDQHLNTLYESVIGAQSLQQTHPAGVQAALGHQPGNHGPAHPGALQPVQHRLHHHDGPRRPLRGRRGGPEGGVGGEDEACDLRDGESSGGF